LLPDHPVNEKRLPQRKSLPHFPALERPNQTVIHFVTVCTKNRQALLASESIHQNLRSAWKAADSFMVGRYVIMPDHLHLFCAPLQPLSGYLKDWVRYWKSLITRQSPNIRKNQFWQKDFWDTQLQRGESYTGKWEYVRFNPVRQKLAQNPEDWPYQGELHSLPWYDL